MRLSLAPTLLAEALRSILRHTARSALSVLGISVGIAAVVWVVALGRAGAARSQAELLALGDNLVWIEAGSRSINGLRTGTHGAYTLTVDDLEAIRAQVPRLRAVSPNLDGSLVLVHGARNWTSRYRGITADYLDIKRWTITAGAELSDDAVRHAANVCLLGDTVKEQLFGDEPAVGETVRVGAVPFEVVGVLGHKGQSGTGQDQDDTVMFPYTTVQQKLRPRGVLWLDDILCSASSSEDVAPATGDVIALLRERHHIGPDDEDDFNIRRPEEIIKAQMETEQTFALLLVSVASVALLVGGVGVMNVMLASVAERSREIGVRLAVGATPAAIHAQFIIEALVLTLFGGTVGAIGSVAGSLLLGSVIGWSLAVPVEAVVVALAFSLLVGLVFGFYPAWLAARLDPVQALQRE